MLRKKITNKEKFQFREEDVLTPLPMGRRNSVQSRLARKADDKLPYNQFGAGAALFGRHGDSKRLNTNNHGDDRQGVKAGRVTPSMTQHRGSPDPVLDKIAAKLNHGDGRHDVKERGMTPMMTQHKGSSDPVLDEIVAKLKNGLQLSGGTTTRYQAAALPDLTPLRKPVANFASSLAVQQEKTTTKFPMPGSVTPPSAEPLYAGGCICFRPLKLVMCEVCGETFRARVSLVCIMHPRAIYLHDVKECKGCKQTNKQAMKEYDLPPGMVDGLKNMDRRSRGVGSY
eukprot:GFUD01018348.1.p1 GENE.GFUD01018348.1~~GFUD01018348.1.p1  ORF type:complete len:284 (-),score=73.54 GFUD01018348.1:284-1135(-)